MYYSFTSGFDRLRSVKIFVMFFFIFSIIRAENFPLQNSHSGAIQKNIEKSHPV